MFPRTIVILAFTIFLLIPASAVVITERPDSVVNGYPIYVTIRDLPENATFSMLVEASFDVEPGAEFRFQMSQFEMPFYLRNSAVTATLEGTSENRLEVMKGDTIVAVSGKSVDGRYTTTKKYDITPSTYDYFRLEGTALPGATGISTMFQVTGTKQGPKDSEISFIVEGVPSGTLTIVVLVDGNQALYKNVLVNSMKPVITTPVTMVEAGIPAPVATISPPGQVMKNFTSADGKASIQVQGVDFVGLVQTSAVNITGGKRVVSGPFSLVPQDLTFLPPARLSFGIPDGIPAAGLAVSAFKNGIWTPIPTEISNGIAHANITGSGTYALLAPVPTATPVITTIAATSTATRTSQPTSPLPTTRTELWGLTALSALVIVGFAVKRK